MFYPNPVKGLREIHRALRPGARLSTMVFSEPQKNPLIGMVVSTALKHAGLPSRDPYQPGGLLSLGKPGLIDALFVQAGFSDVRTTKAAAVFRLRSASEYVEFVRQSGGPILLMLSKLDDAAKNAAWAEMTEKLSAFQTSSGWEGPNELLMTAGTR